MHLVIPLCLRGVLPQHSNPGFSLVELMVVLAIVALMALLAVPSLMMFVHTSTVKAATTELASAIHYARAEAVKRGWPVSVCKSATIHASHPSCSRAARWSDGWLIFVDKDADGVVDQDETSLRVGKPPSSEIDITSSNFSNRISYLATGASNNNGSFTLCANKIARRIVINKTGRMRIESEDCS